MAKRIIIKITKSGEIIGDILGVGGKQCLDYIELVEEITEAVVIEEDKTKEYYQNIVTDQDIKLDNKQ